MTSLSDQIIDAENRVDELKAKYLRASGWERSCKNPMCYWMWEKEIDRKTVSVSLSTALQYQRILDDQEEL